MPDILKLEAENIIAGPHFHISLRPELVRVIADFPDGLALLIHVRANLERALIPLMERLDPSEFEGWSKEPETWEINPPSGN